ncbi:MAG: hypothetical protein NC115_09930 [Bacteroidales bacterium]|nr:hypothetical protein [Bacteroidales bacterium]
MFYYKNWERFCEFLAKSGIVLCTSEQSLKLQKKERFLVLKHDVETSVPNAYKLANIEHKYGICGSYYVQAYLMSSPENIHLLKEMQSWGHEISYHYDVLDANAGDYKAAEASFKEYMSVFADNGFTFGTICQHGNPVKKRIGYTSNRDFFRNPEIRRQWPELVDMVVDYSKHIKTEYNYISDAGYQWNIITLPETNDLYPNVKNICIGSFSNLQKLIQTTDKSYVVSTHPHRWMSAAWQIYLKIIMFHVVCKVVMVSRCIPGVECLLNKFYFLAKKI